MPSILGSYPNTSIGSVLNRLKRIAVMVEKRGLLENVIPWLNTADHMLAFSTNSTNHNSGLDETLTQF